MISTHAMFWGPLPSRDWTEHGCTKGMNQSTTPCTSFAANAPIASRNVSEWNRFRGMECPSWRPQGHRPHLSLCHCTPAKHWMNAWFRQRSWRPRVPIDWLSPSGKSWLAILAGATCHNLGMWSKSLLLRCSYANLRMGQTLSYNFGGWPSMCSLLW